MSVGAAWSRLVPAAVLAVAVGACASEPPEPRATGRRSPFHVGEPFPDLLFPALDGGQPASIRDFRGRKIVLHVFASW